MSYTAEAELLAASARIAYALHLLQGSALAKTAAGGLDMTDPAFDAYVNNRRGFAMVADASTRAAEGDRIWTFGVRGLE